MQKVLVAGQTEAASVQSPIRRPASKPSLKHPPFLHPKTPPTIFALVGTLYDYENDLASEAFVILFVKPETVPNLAPPLA